MRYWYQQPHTSIAGYVRTVLVLDGAPGPDGSDLPLFTNGSPALLCSLVNDAVSRLTLHGDAIPAESLLENEHTIHVAYFFKPFMLSTIFGVSAQILKDKPVELNEWNPQKTIALNLQLLHAQTTDKKIDILNDFISKQAGNNQKECEAIRYATDEMMQNPGPEALTGILAKLEMTERTFQRLFKKYVGITPNQYRRICQFYFAFAQLRGNHFDKLTDIAYTNSYFDQSHYIRSFKEFTGTTPNDYLEFGLKKDD